MGKIPVYQAETQARSAGLLTHSEITGEQAGAGIGRAIAGLGQAIGGLGAGLAAKQEEKDLTMARLKMSDFLIETQKAAVDAEERAGPDGAGMVTAWDDRFRKASDKLYEGAPSEKVRSFFDEKVAAVRADMEPKVYGREVRRAADYAKTETQKSLDGMLTSIQRDPQNFDSYYKQGIEVIDGHYALKGENRENVRTEFNRSAANVYFDTVIGGAQTIEDLEVAKARLLDGKDPVASLLDPEKLNTLTGYADSRRNAIMTGQLARTKADADAVMDQLAAGQEVELATIGQLTKDIGTYGDRPLQIKWQDALGKSAWYKSLKGTPKDTLEAQTQFTKGPKGVPVVGGLLDFIGGAEGADYDTQYGGQKVGLSNMTVNQVLQYQKGMGGDSTAAGKYQILNKTLRGLKKSMGLTGDEIFSPELQDKMALVLVRQRGLDKFIAGEMSVEAFSRSLAQEWASLPLISGAGKGKSFYAGDGINAATVTPEQFLAALTGETVIEGAGGDRGEYVRTEAAKDVLKMYQEGMKADPTQFVIGYTPQFFPDDPPDTETGEGLGARWKGVDAAREYLNEPGIGLLTKEEVEQFSASIDGMDASRRLDFAQRVNGELGADAPEFWKQMADGQPMMSYAGTMMNADPGAYGIARGIIAGGEVLRAKFDKEPIAAADMAFGKDGFDAKDRVPSEYQAFFGRVPKSFETVIAAADALYVHENGLGGEFNQDKYTTALERVMGGTVDTVNGGPMFIPKGFVSGDIENALTAMEDEDLIDLSVGGGAPVYAAVNHDGTIEPKMISSDQFADDAQFEVVADGKYAVRLSDGGYLMDARLLEETRDVNQSVYVMRLGPNEIDVLTSRPRRNAGDDGILFKPLESKPQRMSP